jgi:hypothetical protein
MMKVLLLIDCDCCRQLFHLSRTASTDRIAWTVHSDNLEKIACTNGWEISEDGNSHYCPDCLSDSENMMFRLCPRRN